MINLNVRKAHIRQCHSERARNVTPLLNKYLNFCFFLTRVCFFESCKIWYDSRQFLQKTTDTMCEGVCYIKNWLDDVLPLIWQPHIVYDMNIRIHFARKTHQTEANKFIRNEKTVEGRACIFTLYLRICSEVKKGFLYNSLNFK